MAEYSATRRTPRKHKRVVMKGTEQFDADGVKLEPGDMQTNQQRQSDDDKRILGELPPHWAVFNERPNSVFSAALRLRKTQHRPKADSAS